MMIEVLFFTGCPNLEPTLSLTHAVLNDLGLSEEVRKVEVLTTEDADRLRFLGSPSVRVDGKDIEPSAESRTNYTLSCRLYRDNGVPPRQHLIDALAARR